MRWTLTIIMALALGCGLDSSRGLPVSLPVSLPEQPPVQDKTKTSNPEEEKPHWVSPLPTSNLETNPIEILGFSRDESRLFYTTDQKLFGKFVGKSVPMATLHVFDLTTGKTTWIDSRVALAVNDGHCPSDHALRRAQSVDNGPTWQFGAGSPCLGVKFSDDGRTVVYGRIDESWFPPEDAPPGDVVALFRAKHLALHVWREGEGSVPLVSAVPPVHLAPSGKSVLTHPLVGMWEAGPLTEYHLDDGSVTELKGRCPLWGKDCYEPGSGQHIRVQDHTVIVRNLDDGTDVIIAHNAEIHGMKEAFLTLSVDEDLAVADLTTGELFVSDLSAPSGIRSLHLDREVGLVALVGQGSKRIHVWRLDDGTGSVVNLSKFVRGARVHDQGIVLYPETAWMTEGMWDHRDAEFTPVVDAFRFDIALKDRQMRLLGIGYGDEIHLQLYDDDTMTMSETGRVSMGQILGVLSGGQVVYNDNASGSLTVWDTVSGTSRSFAVDAAQGHTRRDSDWFIAGVGSGLFVVHPGGVTLKESFEGLLHDVHAGEDLVAFVQSLPEGDRIKVVSFDELIGLSLIDRD